MTDLAPALDRAEGVLRRAWRAAIARLRARNQWGDVMARRRLQGIDAALLGLDEAAEEVSAEFRKEVLVVAALLALGIRKRAPFAFDLTHWRIQALLRTMETNLVRVLRASARRAVEMELEDAIGLGLDQVEQLATYRRGLVVPGADPVPASSRSRMLATLALTMRAHQEDRVALWLAQVAVNATALQVAGQAVEFGALPAGSVYLVWGTRRDPLVRDSHEPMDLQRRPLGQAFRSGLGNLLRFPGDPQAPDRDRRGCRCSLTVGF